MLHVICYKNNIAISSYLAPQLFIKVRYYKHDTFKTLLLSRYSGR